MREILFRGKRKDNSKWAYSSRFFIEKRSYVYIPNPSEDMGDRAYLCREVINETIGQYTGLRDKNGEMIFEGDIIKSTGNRIPIISVIQYGEYKPKMIYDLLEQYVFVGQIQEAMCGFYAKSKNGEEMVLTNASSVIEVIGNIHDNPELLKDGAANGN